MLYFTADQHYGDDLMKKLRQYSTTRDMDEDLIKNYNCVVDTNDTVFFVGDFCLKEYDNKSYYKSILKNLNGTKHLILGNHDFSDVNFYREVGFLSVHTSFEMKSEKISNTIVINHDPALYIAFSDCLLICGHVHTLFTKCKYVINVGVDVRDLKPISLEEIIEEFNNPNQFIG